MGRERRYFPFKNLVFGRFVSCRVLQQFVEQDTAVLKNLSVIWDKDEANCEFYDTLNLKTICKNIRRNLPAPDVQRFIPVVG